MKRDFRVAGNNTSERIGNMTIRSLFQQETVVETAQRSTLQWFGHRMRLVEMKQKIIMEARPDGGRGGDWNRSIILRSW